MKNPAGLPPEDIDVRSSLLEAARQDRPPPGTLRKARKALILVATGAAASTTATSTATAATAASGWLVMVQWAGVGAIAGLSTLGAIHLVSPHPATPAPSAAAAVVVTPAADSAGSPAWAGAQPETRPAVSAEEPSAHPVVAATAAPDVSMAPSSEVAVPATLSLAEEVAVLARAIQALARGDAAAAANTLEGYQQQYPAGRLGHEALFIRMQALVQQGNRAEADQLGREFLQAHPDSPLAPRVRELMTGP